MNAETRNWFCIYKFPQDRPLGAPKTCIPRDGKHSENKPQCRVLIRSNTSLSLHFICFTVTASVEHLVPITNNFIIIPVPLRSQFPSFNRRTTSIRPTRHDQVITVWLFQKPKMMSRRGWWPVPFHSVPCSPRGASVEGVDPPGARWRNPFFRKIQTSSQPALVKAQTAHGPGQ